MHEATPSPPDRLAALRALAEPARLALVDELARESACACELRERLRPVGAAALPPPEGAARGGPRPDTQGRAAARGRARPRRARPGRRLARAGRAGCMSTVETPAPAPLRAVRVPLCVPRRGRGRRRRCTWRWDRSGTGLLYGLAGLPRGTRWADAIHFFCFDSTKILLLLVGIIFVVRILRSFLSIERTRALLGGKREGVGNVLAAGLGRRDAVLLVQRGAGVHRLRRRRRPARSDAQLPDREPDGERGRGRAPLRHVRLPDRRALRRRPGS